MRPSCSKRDGTRSVTGCYSWTPRRRFASSAWRRAAAGPRRRYEIANVRSCHRVKSEFAPIQSSTIRARWTNYNNASRNSSSIGESRTKETRKTKRPVGGISRIPRCTTQRTKMTHNGLEPLTIPEDCLPPAFAAWDTPYQHIGVSQHGQDGHAVRLNSVAGHTKEMSDHG